MMGTAAGLDRNLCRCKFLKKRHHLLATKFLPKNRLLGSIDPVKLKKAFRGIHAYSANVFHGQFLLSEIYDALVQAQSMPWEPSFRRLSQSRSICFCTAIRRLDHAHRVGCAI